MCIHTLCAYVLKFCIRRKEIFQSLMALAVSILVGCGIERDYSHLIECLNVYVVLIL